VDGVLLRAAQLHADLHAEILKLSASAALWSNTIGLLACSVHPDFGRLSDKIGRKPLLLACCVAYHRAALPDLLLSARRRVIHVADLVQILFAILIAMFSGQARPRSPRSSRRARARPG
jgi:MFS family permease